MPKWSERTYPTRYLTNTNPTGDKEFHDLDNEKPQCQISKIIKHRHNKPYVYKYKVKDDGFDSCDWCMPGESKR